MPPALNPMDHPVCLSNPDRLLSADASIEHVPFAMWLVSAVRPQRLVELGTRGGNVYLASCQTVASLELSTQCFAMAIFDPDTRTDASGIAALRQHHDPLYGHFSALIPTTPADASQSFDLGSIDILHIDASHPLIRLEDQIRHWHPKMSRSGLIIVRGIESADLGNEDRHAWALLRTKFCCFQFHHDSGLGVLLVGSEPPEVLNAFWDSRDEDSKALKLTFLHWAPASARSFGRQICDSPWHSPSWNTRKFARDCLFRRLSKSSSRTSSGRRMSATDTGN